MEIGQARRMMRSQKVADWNAVNWTSTDAELALQLGVNRKRVGVVRKRLGLPPSRRRRSCIVGVSKRKSLFWDLVNWDLPNSDLAHIWEVSYHRVGAERSYFQQPSAKWSYFSGPPGDEEYLRVVEVEWQKAKVWKTSNNNA